MKRILTIVLTLLAGLSAAPLVAGEPCGCCTSCGCSSCGCADECGCANRYSFHIDRVETRYRVEVDAHKWYVTTAKTTETTVPTTRCVPVTVTDCNGCTHIENKQVADCEKVLTTCADITPVDQCKPKVEERVKVCTTVYLSCGPVVDIHKVAPPPAK